MVTGGDVQREDTKDVAVSQDFRTPDSSDVRTVFPFL